MLGSKAHGKVSPADAPADCVADVTVSKQNTDAGELTIVELRGRAVWALGTMPSDWFVSEVQGITAAAMAVTAARAARNIKGVQHPLLVAEDRVRLERWDRVILLVESVATFRWRQLAAWSVWLLAVPLLLGGVISPIAFNPASPWVLVGMFAGIAAAALALGWRLVGVAGEAAMMRAAAAAELLKRDIGDEQTEATVGMMPSTRWPLAVFASATECAVRVTHRAPPNQV